MAVIQPLIDLVALAEAHGITHAVICPGSRSAAITLAFARNSRMNNTVVMDERAGGYIALGMAQQLDRPVALVCTSGTAAYNFAPAVTEAFFQQIPLLVLTADRPAEWIHQQDGQTLYQTGIYGPHVKKHETFPAGSSHADEVWHANRIVNDIILTADRIPKGPVHLNIPIREPFYPGTAESFMPSASVRKIERIAAEPGLPVPVWHQLQDEWEDAGTILIAGGQHPCIPALNKVLGQITEEWGIPVLGDITSNLQGNPEFITRHDLFLRSGTSAGLKPDLLLTFGQSFLSKPLKLFLRNNPPRMHWHIGEGTHLVDTFQSLTHIIPVSPVYFFNKLLEDIDYKRFLENDEESPSPVYKENWLGAERRALRLFHDCLQKMPVLNDLTLVEKLLSLLPDGAQVHLGNSMPVRYANLIGRPHQQVHAVYANRGTSGIDGCVSTAVGAALVSAEPVYLLVGDVTFLYDRNGLLLESLPGNLKIVVINNGGGNIFRLLPGPDRQPELERYFETKHSYSAKSAAADSGLSYFVVQEFEKLEETLRAFVGHPGIALLEAFTDPVVNQTHYRKLLQTLEEQGG